jgi:hypothetical protein
MPDILGIEAIEYKVIDSLLDRLKAEIIPALEAVIKRRVDDAIEQVSNTIHGALVGAQGIEDKAAADIKMVIGALDGWMVVLDPPIVIRAIRLSKPGAA